MLTAALLLALPVAQAPDDPPDPAAALAAAIDLSSPEERRAAAEALDKRRDVDLEEWLELCRAFAPSGPEPQPGPFEVTVPLWVEDAFEETEISGYVPEGVAHGTPAPLLLHLHGSGGSGAGQWAMWSKAADELGMIVLSPSEAGENEGFAATARERENPLAVLRWARRRFDVDENRIFVTGISRGGHLAWDLITRHPDLWAGAAPLIGGPRFRYNTGENNMRYLANVAHLPIRDLQGAHDDAALLLNLRVAFAALERLGNTDADLIEFPGLGHMFDITAVNWVDFYGTRRRAALPRGVARATASLEEGRAFWIEATKLDRDVAEVVDALTVKDSRFASRTEEEKREILLDALEEKTGLLRAELEEPGKIAVEALGVAKARLLLVPEMLDEKGKLTVLWNGRKKRKSAKPDAEVLLFDFVERFDRTFLPTAAVAIP